jgi:hypothetical protein
MVETRTLIVIAFVVWFVSTGGVPKLLAEGERALKAVFSVIGRLVDAVIPSVLLLLGGGLIVFVVVCWIRDAVGGGLADAGLRLLLVALLESAVLVLVGVGFVAVAVKQGGTGRG